MIEVHHKSRLGYPDHLPSPADSPDIQEALSRAYSDRALLLLPLSSGKIAIFDRSFNLQTLLDEVPTKAELQRLSILYFAGLKRPGQEHLPKQFVETTDALSKTSSLKLNIEI